jgi:hypothetical protein
VYDQALDIDDIWEIMFPDTSRFRVQNASGETVAWFDDFGNLFLKGEKHRAFQWQDPREEIDEFIVEDATGPIVYIDEFGDLYLSKDAADVIQRTTPTASEADEFRVQNSSGADVAIINAADGNVYLKGILVQNSYP